MDEVIFADAAGIPLERAEIVWPYILDAMNEFDIRAARRMACFIGETAHESLNYTHLREDTYYSTAEQVVRIFASHFGAGKADPLDFIRSPKNLANYVYANRGGNGDFNSGDGWRYRAGGYIGITFRKGYEWMEALLNIPLVEEPELIETHEVAAMTAGAYWANTSWKGISLNDYADQWDLRSISGLINRGNPSKTAAGLLDRSRRCQRALRVIEGSMT
jgi:putative chitinase